ncbi:MAG: hypothetical protein NZM06_09505, partial [Chloroherpetonaceae bacterium]|nr:hypothetical protein [Chloroherpetonaceae bacterium]
MEVLRRQDVLLQDIQARIEEAEQEKDIPSSQALERIEGILALLNEKIFQDASKDGLARCFILRARARNVQAARLHHIGKNDLALQALAEAKKDLDAIPASQRDDAFISVQARTDELCAVTHWTLRDYEN